MDLLLEAAVRGTVVDAEGNPVRGAEVFVTYSDAAGAFGMLESFTSGLLLSNSDGSFTCSASHLRPRDGARPNPEGGSRTLAAASSGTQHPPGRSAAGRDFARLPRRTARAAFPGPPRRRAQSRRGTTGSGSRRPTGGGPLAIRGREARSPGGAGLGRRPRPLASGQWRRVRPASPSSAAAASDVVIAGGSLHGRDAAARSQRPALGRHRRGGRRRRILPGYRRTAESRPRSLGSTLTLGLIRRTTLTAISAITGVVRRRGSGSTGECWPSRSSISSRSTDCEPRSRKLTRLPPPVRRPRGWWLGFVAFCCSKRDSGGGWDVGTKALKPAQLVGDKIGRAAAVEGPERTRTILPQRLGSWSTPCPAWCGKGFLVDP